MLETHETLDELAAAAMQAVSKPVYKFNEVKKAFNKARSAYGRRETFANFLETTGLDKQIYKKGSTGGTRVFHRDAVHKAFADWAKEKQDNISERYTKKTSPSRTAQGLILGYARQFCAKKGGTGENRNKLKHDLISKQNWTVISAEVKKIKEVQIVNGKETTKLVGPQRYKKLMEAVASAYKNSETFAENWDGAGLPDPTEK